MKAQVSVYKKSQGQAFLDEDIGTPFQSFYMRDSRQYEQYEAQVSPSQENISDDQWLPQASLRYQGHPEGRQWLWGNSGALALGATQNDRETAKGFGHC